MVSSFFGKVFKPAGHEAPPTPPVSTAKSETVTPPLLQKPATGTTDGFVGTPTLKPNSKGEIPPPPPKNPPKSPIQREADQKFQELIKTGNLSKEEFLNLLQKKSASTPQEFKQILDLRLAAEKAPKAEVPIARPTNARTTSDITQVKLKPTDYPDPLTDAGKFAKNEREAFQSPANNTKPPSNKMDDPFGDHHAVPEKSPIPDRANKPDFSKKEDTPSGGQNAIPEKKPELPPRKEEKTDPPATEKPPTSPSHADETLENAPSGGSNTKKIVGWTAAGTTAAAGAGGAAYYFTRPEKAPPGEQGQDPNSQTVDPNAQTPLPGTQGYGTPGAYPQQGPGSYPGNPSHASIYPSQA